MDSVIKKEVRIVSFVFDGEAVDVQCANEAEATKLMDVIERIQNKPSETSVSSVALLLSKIDNLINRLDKIFQPYITYPTTYPYVGDPPPQPNTLPYPITCESNPSHLKIKNNTQE